MTPKEVWSQSQGSEKIAYLSVLADKMRFLLRSPRGTDDSVQQQRLVVVSGPREGLVPGSRARESQVQVYPISNIQVHALHVSCECMARA